MDICDIPKDNKTCESQDGKRCKYCDQFVYGISDYSFRCTKYNTRKSQIPILNIYKNGKHLRLIKCINLNDHQKNVGGNIND
jgi:hypothetical protein